MGCRDAAKFFSATIAYDKGKPVVRQGRKAVNLYQDNPETDCLVAEGIGLGKCFQLPQLKKLTTEPAPARRQAAIVGFPSDPPSPIH